MTIKKRTATITFVCDECGDEFETGVGRNDEFQDAVEELKREGWRFRQDKNFQWEHICSTCKETK